MKPVMSPRPAATPDLAPVPCPRDRLDELFRLRAEVWLAEGADPVAFPDGRWCDQHDVRRLHWAVMHSERLVAAASLSFHESLRDVDEGEVYLAAGLAADGLIAAPARVAVLPGYRGCGLAQRLLDCQDEASRASGAVIAVRQASPGMVRLLSRRGWMPHGPAPFDRRFPATRFTIMSLRLA